MSCFDSVQFVAAMEKAAYRKHKHPRPGQFQVNNKAWMGNSPQAIPSVSSKSDAATSTTGNSNNTRSQQTAPVYPVYYSGPVNSIQCQQTAPASNSGPEVEEKDTPSVKRLSFEDDVLQSEFTDIHLRPIKAHDSDSRLDNICQPSINENIIINFSKLNELLVDFTKHICDNPIPYIVLSKRSGLCLTFECVCRNCSFSTFKKMFDECTSGRRGPPSGSLNESILLATLKTKAGPDDLLFFLACMNVQGPNASSVYKRFSRISDQVVSVNHDSMLENQKYVQRFTAVRGEDINNVSVETDTSFNNRIQSGYEAGTQSFTPVIEQTTGKCLPIAVSICNKLCNKRKCNHNNEKCKKNYNSEESIASSEAKSLVTNMQSIQSDNILTVQSVTCDGSTQMDKAIRDFSKSSGTPVRRYICFVHRMRTLQKNIKNMIIKTPTIRANCRKNFTQKLSTYLRGRVRLELVRIRKLFSTTQFVEKAKSVISNIVDCISGNHAGCRLNSFVCTAHLPTYSTKSLTYGKHLSLIPADIVKLNNILNNTLSPSVLLKLSRLYNTNKSESMHRRIFTYAPKCTVWTRNIEGLCNSAVHSCTHGTGRSTLIIAKSRGLPFTDTDPFFRYMLRKDKK